MSSSVMVPAIIVLACEAACGQGTEQPQSTGAFNASGEGSPAFKLEIDVLIQSQPGYRVRSQEWGRAFQEIGYFPRFREPRPGEELRVADETDRTSPTVRVVGGMNKDGTIELRGRRFSLNDLKSLKETLSEIERFGASGPPEKNPTWGFRDDQLQAILKQLSDPIIGPVTLVSPMGTVESLELPKSYRLNFTAAARDRAVGKRPETAPEKMDLTGLSKGTGLAILLSQYGLGFRPRRLSADQLVLDIDSGNETSNMWPVGWKSTQSVAEILPAYLKSIDIEVDDYPVDGIATVVAEKLMIPFYSSSFELTVAGKHLGDLKYSRNEKLPPGKLLMLVGDRHELGFDVRVDEAGKIFLWCTTGAESKAFRSRFAHIRQK
ncbi:MAG: hypothetical protein ACK58L_09490 [Planctomycetota bacterium]